MPREIKGIEALSKAFPPEWLFYVSLNCYPRNQDPMEIDAVVVTDSVVLLLEIKDWNGKLTAQQDRWYINGRSSRSPVILCEEKAKKLKAVIRSENVLAGSYYIEARVVLTGTANKSALPQHEFPYVLSLAEACAIGDPAKRQQFLPQRQIKLKKAYEFEAEFDKIFNNAKLFQPLEADWAGFKVVEQDVFRHPRGVWHDHRAERRDEHRIKAMVRTWSFDRLPPGLNSGDNRKLVALRETNAFAYLNDLGSELISRNKVLRDIVTPEDEIATQHFEVRGIGNGWNTLDRYLVQRSGDLSWQDRVVIASGLLNIVSELHRCDVTHRDIGPRAVWIGSPSDMALTGFMCCQLPDKQSVMDWLNDLRGYASQLPEDSIGLKSTGRQRDVYSCTSLVAMILSGVRPEQGLENAISALPEELTALSGWLQRGLEDNPLKRYQDVIELTDEFSAIVEDRDTEGIDQELLDRFETPKIVPFNEWPLSTLGSTHGVRQVYASTKDGKTLMVKVWMSVVRGRSLASDYALLRLLESADRLRGSPVKGMPVFVSLGISPVGAFVVYERCEGALLETITAIPEGAAAPMALQFLLTVAALHDLGCDHGDISPANVLVNLESCSVSLIDPFDMSPVGDGSVRTPSMCPPNWERLDQKALDRYAAIKVACQLLLFDPSPAIPALVQTLSAELDRPVIESLELSTSLLQMAITNASAEVPPVFEISTTADMHGFKGGAKFFVRRKAIEDNLEMFVVTNSSGQLWIKGDRQKFIDGWFKPLQFTSLSYESEAAMEFNLTLSVSIGPRAGFDELYQFLTRHELFAKPEYIEQDEDKQYTTSFDVAKHWGKLVALEEEGRVEIEVREILASRDGVVMCSYENLGKDFDFDDEDMIEVHSWKKRIGHVDLALSSLPAAVAIRCDHGRINIGERLRLVGRREQTSMDRRSRAVKRILEGRSAIPKLIDYFEPDNNVVPISYALTIEDEDVRGYQLNDGQERAFRKLLDSGPVGLLQGPPGTGKTRFIASFVHWLLTKGGCQRILIASQSHEAVNNAIDSLLMLHKRLGSRPSLLRIGSKGITERIKPYHSAELRERYRVKFEAASKFRYSQLTGALGVDRKYASDLFDLDQQVGRMARRCASVQKALADNADDLAVDRERNKVQRVRVEDSFKAAFQAYAGRTVDVSRPIDEYEVIIQELATLHPNVSPADANAAAKALKLTNDWLSSLGSPGRNFEEFLAKTRSVVAATCVGVGQTRIRIDAQVFDWVIVDEAARCTPGELAVPIQMARRVLLVGDHLQLKPMLGREILDKLEESEPDMTRLELAMSDFERAFKSSYGHDIGVSFTEQYRMDPAICAMVSKCFYEPFDVKLETSSKRVPAFSSTDIDTPWLAASMVWVNTDGQIGEAEVQPENSTTYHNMAEVDAVILVLEQISSDKKLVELLSKQEDETPIGVICTYRGQKRRIETAWARHAWDPKFRSLVRIDTVDAYQGKENAIVILSLVRNNKQGSAGHVNEPNRCNVAASRAKEKLIVVGSASMWSDNVPQMSPMRAVIEHMRGDTKNAIFIRAEELT